MSQKIHYSLTNFKTLIGVPSRPTILLLSILLIMLFTSSTQILHQYSYFRTEIVFHTKSTLDTRKKQNEIEFGHQKIRDPMHRSPKSMSYSASFWKNFCMTNPIPADFIYFDVFLHFFLGPSFSSKLHTVWYKHPTSRSTHIILCPKRIFLLD